MLSMNAEFQSKVEEIFEKELSNIDQQRQKHSIRLVLMQWL